MSEISTNKLEDLSISCSWGILNERRIEDALTLEISGDVLKKDRLEHTVSLETCVHLGVTTPVPCLLDIKLKNPNIKINEICIVSEARIIEIYGKCGEYLATSHAEFLDECEDMVVYISEFKFPQASPECSLMFARMKTKGQMWLYGVHISVEKDTNSSETSVNFNNVNKILKESSHQLTEKADKCKKFLQLYASYLGPNSSQALPNSQTLLNAFDSVYISQTSAVSHTKGVGKCLSDLLPSLAAFTRNKSENMESCSGDSYEKNLTCKGTDEFIKFVVEELKQHIDKRFNDLAASFFCNVDRRLSDLEKEQDKKLNDITIQIDKRFNDLAASLFSNIDKKLNDLEEKQNQKLDNIIEILRSVKNKNPSVNESPLGTDFVASFS